MDPNSIALLVNTLGPLLVPLLASALTFAFNKMLGALNPQAQAIVNPFLPVVAGAFGTAMGLSSGNGALTGLVGGLAATGLHQAVNQPVRAATAKT